MALREIRDIRPNVVLEGSFEQKHFGDKREEKKLGFWKYLEIGINLSMFVQDLARRKKEKG